MNLYYAASVPVFRHYLAQVGGLIDRAEPRALAAGIAGAPPAGEQFGIAAAFALGIACPLAGREVPDLPDALAPRMAIARARLGALVASDFADAETRTYLCRAGEALLTQDARSFLFLFGLPNFLFHVTMGFAALSASGMVLEKGDFDGFHVAPPPGDPARDGPLPGGGKPSG